MEKVYQFIYFRYKLLDRLDQDRKLMLFQHLGFVHCPIREHCPAFPNCMDALIERVIAAKRTNSLNSRHQWIPNKRNELVLNLLILGSAHLTSDIINEICLNCGDDGEYIYDGYPYYLNHKIITGEMDSFKSIDFQTSGNFNLIYIKIHYYIRIFQLYYRSYLYIFKSKFA